MNRNQCYSNVSKSLAILLASCTLGCGNSQEGAPQTSDPVQPTAPTIADGTSTDLLPSDEQQNIPVTTAHVETGSYESLSTAPALTIQTVSQSEFVPEIKSASMQWQKQMPNVPDTVSSGTPEWDLGQIAELMAELRVIAENKEGISDSAVKNRIADQNRRIASLASHAITETHFLPPKEPIFNAAVHALAEARFQLALQGDQAAVQEMYDDALMLTQQRPESVAAVTACGAIVRLTRKFARLNPNQSPWLSEYVRHAKLFATNFPAEEPRAMVQLLEAAELCESRGEIGAALDCFYYIGHNFPESPFKSRIESAQRRLNLNGQPFEVAGVTLDGTPFNSNTYSGEPVLIVFWSTLSDNFRDQLPELRQLVSQYKVQVVGVSTDSNSEAVSQFVSDRRFPGVQLFSPNPEERGLQQPLVAAYGVHSLPHYWLIDSEGKVKSTHLELHDLPRLLKK